MKVYLLVCAALGCTRVVRVYENEWAAREALAIIQDHDGAWLGEWKVISCDFVPANAGALI